MRKALLLRVLESCEGSFGVLKMGSFECCTLELPWRNNEVNVSCIPAGTYKCKFEKSPNFGMVYHILDVPFRTNCLFHKGNWGGDVSKGKKSDVEGCILLGVGAMEDSAGQKMLWKSAKAFKRLYAYTGKSDFTLEIRDLTRL